jgi:hypothetical protein
MDWLTLEIVIYLSLMDVPLIIGVNHWQPSIVLLVKILTMLSMPLLARKEKFLIVKLTPMLKTNVLNVKMDIGSICVSSKPIAKLQFVAQYVWVLNRY